MPFLGPTSRAPRSQGNWDFRLNSSLIDRRQNGGKAANACWPVTLHNGPHTKYHVPAHSGIVPVSCWPPPVNTGTGYLLQKILLITSENIPGYLKWNLVQAPFYGFRSYEGLQHHPPRVWSDRRPSSCQQVSREARNVTHFRVRSVMWRNSEWGT